MNRITELFNKKSGGILNLYCTAGYPRFDATIDVMQALEENGADMIELGMPYSDPLADGPVIQHSSQLALNNGMTIEKLFGQLKDFRKKISIPVILMGYMNPVLQFGFEKFCEQASKVGIDGLILPDLPANEFESTYRDIIKKNNLDFIFLVTPETPDERVLRLDQLSSGFLYAVSSSSTTGSDGSGGNLKKYLQKLQDLHLKNPVLVGFGIRNKEGIREISGLAQGAIIGSAYIKALENSADVKASTKSFLSSLLD